MSLVGVYINCDEALCIDCYDPDDWKGFEDWSAPVAMDSTDEADSPAHCIQCGILIEQRLTDEGVDYVIDAMFDDLDKGNRNAVTCQWVEAFEYEISKGLGDRYFKMPLDPYWKGTKYMEHLPSSDRE